MLEVDKIMTKDVLCVHPETNIFEAMKILVDKGISGLPVVDKDDVLVGIISEKDMLKILLSDVIKQNDVVGDYMTKNVISFMPSSSAVEICEFFMDSPIRRVPITENNKIKGVVSRRDIVKLILKIRGSK